MDLFQFTEKEIMDIAKDQFANIGVNKNPKRAVKGVSTFRSESNGLVDSKFYLQSTLYKVLPFDSIYKVNQDKLFLGSLTLSGLIYSNNLAEYMNFRYGYTDADVNIHNDGIVQLQNAVIPLKQNTVVYIDNVFMNNLWLQCDGIAIRYSWQFVGWIIDL
jgi:hypothetical protein